jgi:hypothetical protein
MARLVSVNFRFRTSWLMGGLALMIAVAGFSRAQVPMTPAPARPMTAATNATPLPPVDVMGRYGKILTPSDEVSHPLKLKMPFPGVGEVKVPRQDELNMREKLEQLASLSDDEIRTQLSEWPAYSKMNLRDEGTMLQRIQDFRDYRTRVALQKAHDMGLLTLTPEDKVRFEKEYWTKRLQMEHEISRQFAPILAAHEQKLQDELFREFSSASPGPVAQVPKPAIAKAPVVRAPPTPLASTTASTNRVQPMEPVAQAPR